MATLIWESYGDAPDLRNTYGIFCIQVYSPLNITKSNDAGNRGKIIAKGNKYQGIEAIE